MIHRVHRSHHLVDEDVATSRELYRRDMDCLRGFGRFGIHVEVDGVGCIRVGRDHRRRLLELRHADISETVFGGPWIRLTSWGIRFDPQKFDHSSCLRMGSLLATGSLSLSA
jgi:hypothetical protein